jgi:tetratricopeptide (TPR) repeat protein
MIAARAPCQIPEVDRAALKSEHVGKKRGERVADWYPSSGLTYSSFIQQRSLLNDVVAAQRDSAQETVDAIAQSTRAVLGGLGELQSSLGSSFERLDESLADGFGRVDSAMAGLSHQLESLTSSFEWGFSAVLGSLGGMADSLSSLVKIARTPAQTSAYEQFDIARDAFRRQLYAESLEAIDHAINGHQASAGYKLEWRFHQLAGVIQLGFVGCDAALVDHAAAEAAFLLACRYAKVDAPKAAAFALLSASWAAFVQGKLDDALRHAEGAIGLDKTLGEGLFQVAKVNVALGAPERAWPSLKQAIVLDSGYAIKAAGDGEFNRYRSSLDAFFTALRAEKLAELRGKAAAALADLAELIEGSPEVANSSVVSLWRGIAAGGDGLGLVDLLRYNDEALEADRLFVVAGQRTASNTVGHHMALLAADPYRYDSYSALRRIYMDSHEYDKSWCVCSTLVFLDKADPEEVQFYEQYKPRGFVRAKQSMTEDIWRKAYHPDEDLSIGAIMAAIREAAAMGHAKPHKDFGLRRKDRRDVETDQLPFSKILHYVSQVMNVRLPDVYLQPEQRGEILLANTIEKRQLSPSLVVRADLLQGRPEREIAFVAARSLSLMRPEHFLKLALPTNTELTTALLSAIVLVQHRFPVPPDMRTPVAQFAPELEKWLPPNLREHLAAWVTWFLQNGGLVDTAKWGNAVELTSHRVGLLICGDLSIAAKMISAESPVAGGLQLKDKLTELVLYSVSEDYFAVRAHLGMTIG